MKTYTVKLTQGDKTATAVIRYRDASWPHEIEWTGERAAFRLRDGNPVQLLATMDRLRETVEHQATQAGAVWKISDDGGKAPLRMDELKGEK